MITVEELKNCKLVPPNFIKSLKKYLDELGECDIEDNFAFEMDDVKFDLIEKYDSGWEDDGKYSYADKTYQLVTYDEKYNVADHFNLFINQEISRSGSYFSDYYYDYDKPTIQIATVVDVPEVVIPAHEEVKFEDL